MSVRSVSIGFPVLWAAALAVIVGCGSKEPPPATADATQPPAAPPTPAPEQPPPAQPPAEQPAPPPEQPAPPPEQPAPPPVETPPPEQPVPPPAEPPPAEQPAPEAAPAAPPKTLFERAETAFAQGQSATAFRLLYGHFLTDVNPVPTGLELHWIPALKRPAIAVRCGLGVRYTVTGKYDGAPFPVGVEQEVKTGRDPNQNNSAPNDPAPRRFGQGRRPAQPPAAAPVVPGPGAPTDSNDVLGYYTGEVGQKLVEELRKRVEAGQFGAVLKKMGGSALPAGAGVPGPEGLPGGPAAPAAGATSLGPGIVLLGKGTDAELNERAKAEEVDLLFVLDVQVMQTPKGTVINKTRVLVSDVAVGKTLVETSKNAINNVQVQLARADNNRATRGVDLIDVEFKPLREYLDKEVTAAPMPTLTPDSARNRAGSLVRTKPANPLATLTELRFYHAKKWLPDEILGKAYSLLLGEQEGTKLATGNADDRKQALAKWLPPGE